MDEIEVEEDDVKYAASQLAEDIDKTILCNALGWDIVDVSDWTWDWEWHTNVADWLKENDIKHLYWQNKFGFPPDVATLFILKWK